MLPDNLKSLRESLAPAEPWQYTAFHGVLDLLVIAAVWLVPWPRGGRDG
jgi:hypothetical protein